MATTNSEFTGVFVTDESGNHYLLPNEWATRLRISGDEKRDMEKIVNAEVSGYSQKAVDLVIKYFGAYRKDDKSDWSMPGAGDANFAGGNTIDIRDFNAARKMP